MGGGTEVGPRLSWSANTSALVIRAPAAAASWGGYGSSNFTSRVIGRDCKGDQKDPLPSVASIYRSHRLHRARNILKDNAHPGFHLLSLQEGLPGPHQGQFLLSLHWTSKHDSSMVCLQFYSFVGHFFCWAILREQLLIPVAVKENERQQEHFPHTSLHSRNTRILSSFGSQELNHPTDFCMGPLGQEQSLQ